MAGEITVVGNITVKFSVSERTTEKQANLMRLNVRNALHAMANATLARAQMLAPHLTGALKADGRIEETANGFNVVFGSEAVPYARRRHYENKLHPDTLLYLERAGESVKQEGVKKYL